MGIALETAREGKGQLALIAEPYGPLLIEVMALGHARAPP